jgi:radical SAM protein with 4Fe4S-binding SPASM domain
MSVEVTFKFKLYPSKSIYWSDFSCTSKSECAECKYFDICDKLCDDIVALEDIYKMRKKQKED